MVLNGKRVDFDYIWEEILYSEGETLEQVAQQGCGCPLPDGVQGQAGWGFEQPGLEGSVHTYSRGLELGDLKGSPQPKPFHDSMILFWILGFELCFKVMN